MTGGEVGSTPIWFAHEKVRESQSQMMWDGIEVLSQGGFLIAAAPTGIGKTAAALASALEVARSMPSPPRILFLTGTQSQHRIVVETVRTINRSLPDGILDLKLVDLIGREGMCHTVDRVTGRCDCEEDIDPEARVERRADLKEAMFRVPMHVDEMIRQGRNMRICSWAAAREAAKECDILVCDYNHVFIENVREASLPVMGIDLAETIIIVDEAHNLPDRVRNGLQRVATMKVFRDAKAELEEHLGTEEKKVASRSAEDLSAGDELQEIRFALGALTRLNESMPKWFESRLKELASLGDDDMRISTAEFIEMVNSIILESIEIEDRGDSRRLTGLISQLLRVRVETDDSIDDEDEKETASTRLAMMLSVCLEYRDSPALVLVFDLIGDEPRISSHLLDPGVVSGDLFNACGGSILMSGTLVPPQMYADLLRLPTATRLVRCRQYTSPFSTERRPILIAKDTTSKFTERSESNTDRIRDHILSVIENTPGHVALFAPSYALLREIIGEEDWLPWGIRRHLLIERSRMSKRQVNEMIEKLYQKRRTKDRALLAGVLSGKMAEGVDYPENILDAVVCVGIPVPPPSARQDALKKYCEDRFGRDLAWRYSSSQPAVNSLLQALGRPIRKREDRALVVLLDRRLLRRPYRHCLPSTMSAIEVPDASRTARHVKRFFERHPEPAIEAV
jgi:DNA excision repair protein ERCC-2